MIKVGDEGQDFGPQVVLGGKVAPLDHLPDEDAQPNLHLIAPRGMGGHVQELNAMGRVAQEGGAPHHGLEDAVLAFCAQVVGQLALLGHQPHQCFGLVGVQLVGDKEPGSLRIGGDSLGDMGCNVGFGAGRPNARRNDLPSSDLKIGDQAQGSMAYVCELPAFGLAGLHRLGRRAALQRLYPGHFITTDHPHPPDGQQDGIGVDRTEGADLLRKAAGVSRLRFGIEPVATEVRPQRGLILKNAPPIAEKSGARSLVSPLRPLLRAASRS